MRLLSSLNKKKVSSIRTPMLIQGRLERTATNPMQMGGELNARKPTKYILDGAACE